MKSRVFVLLFLFLALFAAGAEGTGSSEEEEFRRLRLPLLIAKETTIIKDLWRVRRGSLDAKEFYQRLAGRGQGMRDVIAAKSALQAGGPEIMQAVLGGSPLASETVKDSLSGKPSTVWREGAGSQVEKVLLTWRRDVTKAAIAEVVRQFQGRIPANNAGMAIAYVGKWTTQTPADFTFAGDIDFSFVSTDTSLSTEMKQAFDKYILDYTGMTTIGFDSVATAHGKAGTEVYMGRPGIEFAERNMGIVEDVDLNTGARKSMTRDELLARLDSERGSDIWRKNPARLDPPVAKNQTEPGLSMEMIRHFHHDIVESGIFGPTDAIVKAAKYLKRSDDAFMAVFPDARGAKPKGLSAFAQQVTAMANSRASQEEMDSLLAGRFGTKPPLPTADIARFFKVVSETMWKNVGEAVETRTANLEGRMAGLANSEISRDDPVAKRREAEVLRKEVMELIDVMQGERRLLQRDHVRTGLDLEPALGKLRAMADDIGRIHKIKGFSEDDLKFKKAMEDLPNTKPALLIKVARAMQWMETKAQQGVDLADFLDNKTMGQLRTIDDFAAFEANVGAVNEAVRSGKADALTRVHGVKLAMQERLDAVNGAFNDAIQGTAFGRGAMKALTVYNIADESMAYCNAYSQGDWEGLATEIFRRRVPFGQSLEDAVMGNYLRAGWGLVTTLVPPLGLPEAALGIALQVEGKVRASYWSEQLALFTDGLYDTAKFELKKDSVIEVAGARMGEWRLVSVRYGNSKAISLDDLTDQKREQIASMRQQLGTGLAKRNIWVGYKEGITDWSNVNLTLRRNLEDTDPMLALFRAMLEDQNVAPRLAQHFQDQYDTRWEEVKLGFVLNLIDRLERRKSAEQILDSGGEDGFVPELVSDLEQSTTALGIRDQAFQSLEAAIGTNWIKRALGSVQEWKRILTEQPPPETERTRAVMEIKRWADAYRQIWAKRTELEEMLSGGSPASDQGIRFLHGPDFLTGTPATDRNALSEWGRKLAGAAGLAHEELTGIKQEYIPGATLDQSGFDHNALNQVINERAWIELWGTQFKKTQDPGLTRLRLPHVEVHKRLLFEFRAYYAKSAPPLQTRVTARLISARNEGGGPLALIGLADNEHEVRTYEVRVQDNRGRDVPLGKLSVKASHGQLSSGQIKGPSGDFKLSGSPLTLEWALPEPKGQRVAARLAFPGAKDKEGHEWLTSETRLEFTLHHDKNDEAAKEKRESKPGEEDKQTGKEKEDETKPGQDETPPPEDKQDGTPPQQSEAVASQDFVNISEHAKWLDDHLIYLGRLQEAHYAAAYGTAWRRSNCTGIVNLEGENSCLEGEKNKDCSEEVRRLYEDNVNAIKVARQETDAIRSSIDWKSETIAHQVTETEAKRVVQAMRDLDNKYRSPMFDGYPDGKEIKYEACGQTSTAKVKGVENAVREIPGVVGPEQGPELAVTLDAPAGPHKYGQKIALSAKASGGNRPYSFQWQGIPGSGSQVSFIPLKQGKLSLGVTVSDSAGHLAKAQLTIKVEGPTFTLSGLDATTVYGTRAKLTVGGQGAIDPCEGKSSANATPFDECKQVTNVPTIESRTMDVAVAPVVDSEKGQDVFDPTKLDDGAPTESKKDGARRRFVWQSSPGLTFDPATSDNGTTTVTFDRMGEIKVWCEVLEEQEEGWVTLGETAQQSVQVTAPAISLRFDPAKGQARIGQEVRVRIISQPEIPANLVDYRWFDPESGNRMEYTNNASDIGFKVKDDKPLSLKALARVPVHGDEIATIEDSYSAAAYQVSIGEPRSRGPRLQVWRCETQLGHAEDCGMKEIPDGQFVTFQDIHLQSKIEPEPEDAPLYRWSVRPDGVCGLPGAGAELKLNCSQSGDYTVRLDVFNRDKQLLGKAERTVTIAFSQKDASSGKKSAELETRLKEARQHWSRGETTLACDKARAAQVLDVKIAGAEGLAKQYCEGAKKITQAVKEGEAALEGHDLKKAQQELEAGSAINARAKELQALAQKIKQQEQRQQQVEQLIRQAEQRWVAGDIEAAAATIVKAIERDARHPKAQQAAERYQQGIGEIKSALDRARANLTAKAPHAEALEAVEEALAVNGRYAPALKLKGEIEKAMQAVAATKAACERRLQQIAEGSDHYTKRNWAKSIKVLEQALNGAEAGCADKQYEIPLVKAKNLLEMAKDNEAKQKACDQRMVGVAEGSRLFKQKKWTKSSEKLENVLNSAETDCVEEKYKNSLLRAQTLLEKAKKYAVIQEACDKHLLQVAAASNQCKEKNWEQCKSDLEQALDGAVADCSGDKELGVLDRAAQLLERAKQELTREQTEKANGENCDRRLKGIAEGAQACGAKNWGNCWQILKQALTGAEADCTDNQSGQVLKKAHLFLDKAIAQLANQQPTQTGQTAACDKRLEQIVEGSSQCKQKAWESCQQTLQQALTGAEADCVDNKYAGILEKAKALASKAEREVVNKKSAVGNVLVKGEGKFSTGENSPAVSERFQIPAGKGQLTFTVSYKPWLGGQIKAQACKENYGVCSGVEEFFYILGNGTYTFMGLKHIKEEIRPDPWVNGKEAYKSVTFALNPANSVEMMLIIPPQQNCNLAGMCTQLSSKSWVEIRYSPE